MLGLIWVMTGVPAVMLNPPFNTTFWLLVLTVILRLPTAALVATVMLAVNCVALLTVTRLTAIPDPKLTVEKPCWKVVNSPVMTILAVVPAWAVLGEAL